MLNRESKFTAFISYSQRDATLAKKIHHALQNYRIPRRLVGDNSNIKRRSIGRIFRDEENLGADPSLREALNAMIDSSSALIVVCTPESAKSMWVNREIIRFKRRPDPTVFAVIAEGTPHSSSPATECYAPALSISYDSAGKAIDAHDEPFAPNLKKESFNKVITRIVSGLLDIPFDELWQHEKRRRRTRAASIAITGSAIMAVFFVIFQRERDAKNRNESLLRATLSVQESARGNIGSAALLALEALPMSLDNPEKPFVHEAGAALHLALSQLHERHTLACHSDSVSSASFSPDGSRAVTASRDSRAIVWDLNAGSVLSVLTGHLAEVTDVVFRDDSSTVITASKDRTIRFWDAITGVEILALPKQDSTIRLIDVSPDGKWLATTDGTARIWNIKTGALVSELKNQKEVVFTARFSTDSNKLVTASGDNSARIWRVRNGELLHELSGHGSNVYSAEFSPDGAMVVTASGDGTARVWDANNGAQISTLADHLGIVTGAQFNADSSKVLTASADYIARIWDVDSGLIVHELEGHGKPRIQMTATFMARFSPDGNRVITTASEDSDSIVWNAQNGNMVSRLSGHRSRITSVLFSSDGSQVISASVDNTARVWDVDNNSVVKVLAERDRQTKGYIGDKGSLFSNAKYSHDGSALVASASDNTASLWNFKKANSMQTLAGHNDTIQAMDFNSDDTRVLTVARDGVVKIWSRRNSELISTFEVQHGGASTAKFVPGSDQILILTRGGKIFVWDASSETVVTSFTGQTKSATHLRVSANGALALTIDKSDALVWDIKTGSIIHRLSGHATSVRSIQFSPDDSRIATASYDKTAMVWRVDDGKLVHKLIGHNRWVNSAEFGPEGNLLVTTSEDKTVRVWDLDNGTQLSNLSGHRAGVSSGLFSPDGTQVLSVSHAGIAIVWDIASASIVVKLKQKGNGIARAIFSPNGTQVVTSADDFSVRLWNVKISQEQIDLVLGLTIECDLTL